MIRLLLILYLFSSIGSLHGQSEMTKSESPFAQLDNIEVQIFPNPTSDIFYLKNDEDVNKIMLYNIVGKEVRSYTHHIGNGYTVDDLRKGIYIVRLFDKKGKIIKVLRLSRK